MLRGVRLWGGWIEDGYGWAGLGWAGLGVVDGWMDGCSIFDEVLHRMIDLISGGSV